MVARSKLSRRQFGKWVVKNGVLVPFVASKVVAAPVILQTPARGVVAAGGGGGCTVNSGNVFNECFEGTGYENTWTEVAGTPDPNAALPASFSRLGSQCLGISFNEDQEYIRKDEGSAVTSGTRWFRIYFYMSSDNFPEGSGEAAVLISAWETTDTSDTDQRAFVAWMIRDGGRFIKVRGDTVGTADVAINQGEWYRLEIQWVRGTTSEFKIFNSSDSQVGTTQSFTAGPLADWRYTVLGQYESITGAQATYYIDGVGVDSTGYIGQ